MTYAAITGWGKCMPPAVLTNADLASLLDTDDEWITSRTGIRERRVSHVTGIELSHVAAARALACAGLAAARRRAHRLRQLLERRADSQFRVGRCSSGSARANAARDGRQHRVHELPVRALDGHRDDPHRRRQERAWWSASS